LAQGRCLASRGSVRHVRAPLVKAQEVFANSDGLTSAPGFVGIAVALVVVLAVVVPMRDRDLEAHVMSEPSLPVKLLEVLDVTEHLYSLSEQK